MKFVEFGENVGFRCESWIDFGLKCWISVRIPVSDLSPQFKFQIFILLGVSLQKSSSLLPADFGDEKQLSSLRAPLEATRFSGQGKLQFLVSFSGNLQISATIANTCAGQSGGVVVQA